MTKRIKIALAISIVSVIMIVGVILLTVFRKEIQDINPFALPSIHFAKEKFEGDVYTDITLPTPVFSKSIGKDVTLTMELLDGAGKEVDIRDEHDFYAETTGDYKYRVTLQKDGKESVGETVITVNELNLPTVTLRKFSAVSAVGRYTQFPSTIIHDNVSYEVEPDFDITHVESGAKESVTKHGFIPSKEGEYDVKVTVKSDGKTAEKTIRYYVRKEGELESADKEIYLDTWDAYNGGTLSYTTEKTYRGEGAFLFEASASADITWPVMKMIEMPVDSFEDVMSLSCWVYNDSGFDVPLYYTDDPLGVSCGTAYDGRWTKITIQKEDFPKYFIPQGDIDHTGFYLVHKGGPVRLYFDEFKANKEKVVFHYEEGYDNHVIGTKCHFPKVSVEGLKNIQKISFRVYDQNGKEISGAADGFTPDKIGVYTVECMAETTDNEFVDTYELAVMGGYDSDDFSVFHFKNGAAGKIVVEGEGLYAGSFKALKVSLPVLGYPEIMIRPEVENFNAVRMQVKAEFRDPSQKGQLTQIPLSNMVTGANVATVYFGKWTEITLSMDSLYDQGFGVVMEKLAMENPQIDLYIDCVEYFTSDAICDMRFTQGFVAGENTRPDGLYDGTGTSIYVSAPRDGYPTIVFQKDAKEYMGVEFWIKTNVKEEGRTAVTTVPFLNHITGAVIAQSTVGEWNKIYIDFSKLTDNRLCLVPDIAPVNGAALEFYIDKVKYYKHGEYEDTCPDIDSVMTIKGAKGLEVVQNYDKAYLYDSNSVRSVKVSVPGFGYPELTFDYGKLYTNATVRMMFDNVRDADGNPVELSSLDLSDMATGAPLYTLKAGMWTEIHFPLVDGQMKVGFLQDRPPLQDILFDVYIDDAKLVEREEKEMYEVTFMVDGEIYYKESTYVGTKVEMPKDPYKEGYVFEGWYDQEEGGNRVLTIDAAGTVYARFTKKPDSVLDIAQTTTPFWDNNLVIAEPLVFTETNEAQLFYKEGVKILAITTADMKQKYKEGVDYTYTADGKVTRIANGGMISTTQAFLDAANGWGSSVEFFSKQVYVTYIHTDEFDSASKPVYKGSKLPKTIAKLQNKEKVKIVFTGDSITNGGDSSYAHNVAPYQRTWNLMLIDSLREAYDNPNVVGITQAYSGANSMQALFTSWGEYSPINEVKAAAGSDTDLLVIGYGMNDIPAGLTPADTIANINAIADAVRKSNPDLEVLVISTMLPYNDKMNDATGRLYPTAFKNAFDKTGSAVADMTSIHEILLERKDYYSMSGNGINHPNDFLIRIYTQVLNATLIEDPNIGTVTLPDFAEDDTEDTDTTAYFEAQYANELRLNTDAAGLRTKESTQSVKYSSRWNLQYEDLKIIVPAEYDQVSFWVYVPEILGIPTSPTEAGFWSTATGELYNTFPVGEWTKITRDVVNGQVDVSIVKDGYRTPNLQGGEFDIYFDDIEFTKKEKADTDSTAYFEAQYANELRLNTDAAGLRTGESTQSVKYSSRWNLQYEALKMVVPAEYDQVSFWVYVPEILGIPTSPTEAGFWSTVTGALYNTFPVGEWTKITRDVVDGQVDVSIVKDGYRTPNLQGGEFDIYFDDIEFIKTN